MAKRVAALDVGDRRIGVAVSDALGLTAQPLGVITRTSVDADVRNLLTMLGNYEVERVVAGLPLHMDGRESDQSRRVRAFCDALASRTGLEIVYQDERMTTVQSERILVEAGMRRNKRRGVVDKLAAVLILQAHLATRPAE